MKVTIKEVSKHCGLSTATVSNVLHGTKPVKQETAKKVLNSVKKLGYIPNESARQLKAGSSRLIGVLTIGYNHFFTEILNGIQSQAETLGWKIIVGSTDEDIIDQQAYLDSFIAKRVEGIIMAPTYGWTEEMLERYSNTTPLVLIDRKVKGYEDNSLTTNNRESSKIAVNHLIHEHCYKHIGLIYANTKVSSMEERKSGYEEAVMKSEFQLTPSLMVGCDGSVSGGKQAMKKMLEKNPRLEAVHVTNNNMLLGVYKEIQERGIRVPDDIAVIGFDVEPWMDLLNPKVTIIEQPVRHMGKQSLSKLLELKNDERKKIKEFNNVFHIAGSCGCTK
ncbi:LacI family DNA-binding transcriptional regulator [Virgibacillus salexigens]|uniref:LacI family DNA-binding transcriptional regulator n=1 Tax=Virgibacillus salexigens TaxID=61016 RepID=UPI003081DE2D